MLSRGIKRSLGVIGLVSCLAVAVACGSGGASGSISGSTPTQATGVAAADVTIRIGGMNGSNSFSPNPSSIVAGQTVAFFNADSIVHTATADNGAFNTGNIAPGATSAPITMSAAGSYNYHCAIHPTMTGTLNVTGQ